MPYAASRLTLSFPRFLALVVTFGLLFMTAACDSAAPTDPTAPPAVTPPPETPAPVNPTSTVTKPAITAEIEKSFAILMPAPWVPLIGWPIRFSLRPPRVTDLGQN